MAWMETDYSKHTYFRWKVKWRLEHLDALGTMGGTAPLRTPSYYKIFLCQILPVFKMLYTVPEDDMKTSTSDHQFLELNFITLLNLYQKAFYENASWKTHRISVFILPTGHTGNEWTVLRELIVESTLPSTRDHSPSSSYCTNHNCS